MNDRMGQVLRVMQQGLVTGVGPGESWGREEGRAVFALPHCICGDELCSSGQAGLNEQFLAVTNQY